jgi:hypothetical protein
MTINGDNKVLRLALINLPTLIIMTIGLIGIYYKFDARITALERNGAPTDLTSRVLSVEKKIDEIVPRIIRTDTNVLWLMSKQPGAPKE